jgi:hypothetical protein
MLSLPILLIHCNDHLIMGIQLCNMNMKFAALLLFVGVASATWCWQKDSDKCLRETEHNQATIACCAQVGGDLYASIGCGFAAETIQQNFDFCCVVTWDCTGTEGS